MFSLKKVKNNNLRKNISSYLVIFGTAFVAVSLAFGGFIFYPLIKAEISYRLNKPDANAEVKILSDEERKTATTVSMTKVIEPIDSEFGIIIPKIKVNSKVIKNVNPFDSAQYQEKLSEGVAHASGTKLPGQKGNVFLFAHSSENFYEANRYNAEFYLLDKMNNDERIFLSFEKKVFEYKIVEKKYVNPDEVEFLNSNSDKEKLTLMTCWPAGTPLKRLIVIAERV